MKKTILILCGILVAIYLVFSLIDTGEYRVEKRLWRMQKKFSVVAQDPKAVPRSQFESLVKDYRKLIKKYPKSRYVPQMYSRIGSLYLLSENYDEARKAFGDVVRHYADNQEIASKAMMDIGNTYLMQKERSRAIDVYRTIWKDYERTEVGFMMPLYIAGVFRNDGQNEMMTSYLNEAVAFYRKIINNKEEEEFMRLNAYQMLATAYLGLEKWQLAFNTLKDLLYRFADSRAMTPQRLSIITRMINVTAVVRLQDYDKAIHLYQEFIDGHPGHYLNQFLQKVVESLNYLKENRPGAVVPQQ